MNNLNIKIWNREFDLPVVFDCFDDEEIIENQKSAVNAFLDANLDESFEEIKSFCLKNNGDDIGTDVIDNIFKYVMPKSIYVPRDKRNRIIAIMCDYKFDIEHGIAVVFVNNKFLKVVPQDDIL